MDIDRQRISAVRTLEAIGYSYINGEWLAPTGPSPARQFADADATQVSPVPQCRLVACRSAAAVATWRDCEGSAGKQHVVLMSSSPSGAPSVIMAAIALMTGVSP